MEQGMYVSLETVVKCLSLITGLAAVIALLWNLFKWVNHQKEQDAEIEKIREKQAEDVKELRSEFQRADKELEAKHDREVAEMKASTRKETNAIHEEQTLIMYGMLACLQGLNGMGCGDPIPKTIDKINKYLNQKAHDQQSADVG